MNRTKTLGWLVGAAALLFAGCSSEDGVIEEQTPQQPQQTQATIHVTVGAGITDGEATTRSTVDYTGGTRTLQFTSGDRLYVWGQKDKIYDQFDTYYCEYVVAGTLELVAIDPEDPTKATFSGDLSVYRAEVQGDYAGGTDILMTLSGVTYPDGNLVSDLSAFLQSADPLAGFENVKATLIHEDAVKDDARSRREDQHEKHGDGTEDCHAAANGRAGNACRRHQAFGASAHVARFVCISVAVLDGRQEPGGAAVQFSDVFGSLSKTNVKTERKPLEKLLM